MNSNISFKLLNIKRSLRKYLYQCCIILLSFGASLIFSSAINASTACPVRSDVGMNIAEFNYFTSAVPFKDVALQNVEGIKSVIPRTNAACPTPPLTDTEGYPLDNQPTCVSRLVILRHITPYQNLSPYKGGQYILTYDGSGTIKLSGDAVNQVNSPNRITFDTNPSSVGITVDITQTDSANHLRNIHIFSASDEATYKTQPFNTSFLNVLKPFSILRFMGAARTNTDNVEYRAVALNANTNSAILPDLGKNGNNQTISIPSWKSGAFKNVIAYIHRLDTNQWETVFIDSYDASTRTITFKNNVAILDPSPQQMPEITIKSFYNQTWASRTLPLSIKQTSDSGIAWIYMIKMANILNKDLWINVPTAADDRYVTLLATQLKNQLKPNLKIYLEYSNEVWVNKFPQATYAYLKAKQVGFNTAQDYYVYRSIEIFKLFNTVFQEPNLHVDRSNSRLVRVLSEQTTVPNEIKSVLDWNQTYPTDNHAAYEFADALGVINYFGLKKVNFDFGTPDNEPTIDSIFAALTASINKAYDTTAAGSGWLPADAQLAKDRGLKLVAYEGGHNMVAPQNPDRVDLLPIIQSALDDPRMKAIYEYNWDKWTSLKDTYGVDLGAMNQYYAIGTPGINGFWGMLDSVYQDPNSSQRYLGLISCPTTP